MGVIVVVGSPTPPPAPPRDGEGSRTVWRRMARPKAPRSRIQFASEPDGLRFIGKNGTGEGNYSSGNPAPRKTMSELRAGWGFSRGR
jgi:hypothetical protein